MGKRVDSVKIVEVGPRDGLQNEPKTLSVADRIEFLNRLINAGLKWLEGGSFVSPKAIPQMVNSEDVWKHFQNSPVDLSFLLANEKGLERALVSQVKSISVFTATSDEFTKKNINQTVDESLNGFKPILEKAKSNSLRIRGYISTAFGCPYEGPQQPKRVVEIVRKLFELGCDEISIGDTIGVAHPKQVEELLMMLKSEASLNRIAMHFHDTRGMALLNIETALRHGIRIFDSSVGGLGGCPYATGSSGNVATEEVVWMCEGFGYETGVSVEELLKTAEWVSGRIERELKGKLYLSKPKRLYYGVKGLKA